MKALRKYIDKIKPQFEKGGKFEKLHSTFGAFETFLYVPDKVTFKGSHIRDTFDLKRAMIVVVVAVIPALLFGMWNTGYQHFLSLGETVGFWDQFWYGFLKVLPIIIVSYVVGLGIEFAFAQYRGHEVNEGYLVSGMLIPLIVPPDIPLWMLAISIVFAVVIGKEVFGGTGMNILNPALTARAFLFFTGIASWRVMFSVFAGGYIMGLIFNFFGANDYMNLPAYYHLIMGGFAFGAVFMATDPVTAAQTNKGKYIYGFLIGIMAVIIRVVNPAYPEGMMLAILLMNVFAPLIDHYVVESNIKRRLKRIKIKA